MRGELFAQASVDNLSRDPAGLDVVVDGPAGNGQDAYNDQKGCDLDHGLSESHPERKVNPASG